MFLPKSRTNYVHEPEITTKSLLVIQSPTLADMCFGNWTEQMRSGSQMKIEIPVKNAPDSSFETLWIHSTGLIKRGTSRDVYEISGHSDKVLKVSNRPSNFCNWAEILIHNQLKDTGDLAEIFSWSWSGKFLVMERLTWLKKGDTDAYNFPVYLSDRKPENYGRDSAGKIKALDYASLKLESLIPYRNT